MASTQLTRTLSGNGNGQIFTLSCWLKRSKISDYGQIFSMGTGISDGFNFGFHNSDQLHFESWDGSTNPKIRTNRLFRDVSAFYNLVLAVDTTQATASDRVKFYVNGVQETSFAIATYPSQNYTFPGTNQSSDIARVGYTTLSGSWTYFDGSMAHVHWIDGTAYDADTFGETDSTTGIWKPKTAPSVTYGTNGFFLKFENSGAFGTDSSGNANTFTVNGTMTQTIDTPSNVFATLNPLWNSFNQGDLSEGNLKSSMTSGAYKTNLASFGVSQGKWYWEIKLTQASDMNFQLYGVTDESTNKNVDFKASTGTTVYNNTNGKMQIDGSEPGSASAVFAQGDIVGIALNMDDKEISIYKNGSALHSDVTMSTTSNLVFPCHIAYTYSTYIFEYNFGNGYFGTTAVSSAQNPDDGIGIFEYAVPTGYKALCTKSINAQEYD